MILILYMDIIGLNVLWVDKNLFIERHYYEKSIF